MKADQWILVANLLNRLLRSLTFRSPRSNEPMDRRNKRQCRNYEPVNQDRDPGPLE